MDEENNVIQTVSNQSYGSRIKDSCQGMCLGLVFIFGAIALLVWNEGNAVATQKALDEGAANVVSLTSIQSVDSIYQGKLVHLTGEVMTEDKVRDDIFGVAPVMEDNVLKLERRVEMYQWIENTSTETKKNTGGSTTTTTTYSYTKDWRSDLIPSSNFQDPNKHQNPSTMPYRSETFTADPITLGAFTLPNTIINRLNWYEAYSEAVSTVNITDAKLRNKTKVYNNNRGFYISSTNTTTTSNPNTPLVGDMRVSYRLVTGDTISLIAKQVGNTFEAYRTDAGNRDLLLLERGTLSADAMFDEAEDDKTAQAWALRFVGFLIMYIGFLLLAAPLSTFADVLPFLGDMVGSVAACLLFPIAALLSLFVIGISWIAFRPGLALGIMAIGIGGGFAFWYFVLRERGVQKKASDEDGGDDDGKKQESPKEEEEDVVVVDEEDVVVEEEEDIKVEA